jgi:CelD/BcsL family acetyltransferase involved in cellulose biosynthesis
MSHALRFNMRESDSAAGIKEKPDLTVELARGLAARQLLESPHFATAWEALFAACPWATVYNSPAFARTWYEVYEACYDPVVVLSRGPAGQLHGLLLLGLEKKTGVLVHVGAHHAEYQSWLSRPEWATSFIVPALAALRGIGRGTLEFLFLAQGSPLDWTVHAHRAGVRTSVVWHKRGLMQVGVGASIAASLGKKHNKTLLSRLKKIGPVRIQQLMTAAELEAVIDIIVEHCDVRQGAAHGALPFARDRAKRAFYLSMMAAGLLHATVLWAGNVLLAAHLGFRDRGMLSLGLITHAPQYSQHSPGKFMILLLGQLLGEHGDERFDLTPGGTYKDRFATSSDDVAVLEVFLSPSEYARHLGRRAFVAFARMAAVWFDADARVIGERVKRALQAMAVKHWPRMADTGLKALFSWVSSEREYRLYQWDASKPLSPGSPRIRRNKVGDLLLYRPESSSSPSLTEFLSAAHRRLERGEILFSAVENGLLAHCSWLIPVANSVETDWGDNLPLSAGCAVLQDDCAHFGPQSRELYRESIIARLQHVATQQPGSSPVIGVPAENRPARHDIEKTGFEYCGSARVRIRLGRASRSTQGAKPPLEMRPATQASATVAK